MIQRQRHAANSADSLLFSQPGGPGSGFPPDRKGKTRASPANGNPNGGDVGAGDFLALDIDGDRGESGTPRPQDGGFAQMQLVEQQVSRSDRLGSGWVGLGLVWLGLGRMGNGESVWAGDGRCRGKLCLRKWCRAALHTCRTLSGAEALLLSRTCSCEAMPSSLCISSLIQQYDSTHPVPPTSTPTHPLSSQAHVRANAGGKTCKPR